MKKLLILGGSGFVGKSFVDCAINKKLVKNNINEIIILSRKIKSKIKKIKHVKINYVGKNILNIKNIPEVDYIIYCIKSNNIRTSNAYFNQFLRLVTSLKKKPKILFTSSGAVYGVNNTKKKFLEDYNIDLKSIDRFSGYKRAYATEKLFLEKKFKKLADENFKVSIARCYTFIGKKILNQKYAISDMLNNLQSNEVIKLNTKNQVYRSYMYDDDMVEWLIKIVKNSNNQCPIYNVGSNEEINLRKLIKILAKKFNKKYKLNKVITKKIDYYVPVITKAKKELNLNVKTKLMNAINLTIRSTSEKN